MVKFSLWVEHTKQAVRRRILHIAGTKAELKQELSEQLEKARNVFSLRECVLYNITLTGRNKPASWDSQEI